MGTPKSGTVFSPLGTAALASGMFGSDNQAALVSRISERLAEASERLRESLSAASPADANAVIGEAWSLARLESDADSAAAVLFLAAAVLSEESRGGSCLRLAPAERDGLAARLRAVGASEKEMLRALALLVHLTGEAAQQENLPEACALGVWSEAKEASVLRRPLLAEQAAPGDWILSLERTRCLEDELAGLICGRLGRPAPQNQPFPTAGPLAANSESDSERPGVSSLANAGQREAIGRVLEALARSDSDGRGSLVVVTGGPGTGKTFTVAQLLRAIREHAGLRKMLIDGNAVRFTAPTGKAADRMFESMKAALSSSEDDRALLTWIQSSDVRPQTIHRLLGANPRSGTFRFHLRNPLPARLVVADEASMVGVALMDRLVKAVPPDAVLVLLGDEHQLPSVEAGAVLRDLCRLDDMLRAAPSFPGIRVHLTESRRQSGDEAGQRIIGAAARINDGEMPRPEDMPSRDSARDVEFSGVEHLGPEALADLCGIWAQRSVSGEDYGNLVTRTYALAKDGAFSAEAQQALIRLFAQVQSRIVLCATRVQTARLNSDFHRRQVRFLDGCSNSGNALFGKFVPGEPVMMTRNDDARGIFNGDMGVVLRVRRMGERSGRFHAVFRTAGGFRAFLLGELWDDLVHAFAMTVHKSQGSEYRDVVLVLPQSADSPLLSREIVYTAVTRAKTSVVVCGTRECLEAGIGRVNARSSALAERCRARLQTALGTSEKTLPGRVS